LLSGVAISHLLLAKRAFDSAGNRIAEPDDSPKKKECKHELKGVDHDSSP